VPQRPFLNVLAWPGALGVALLVFGGPPAQASTREPGYWPAGSGWTGNGSQLAQPRFRIPAQPSLFDLLLREPDRPVRNNVPMPTPPPFDQRPVDNAVAVFIPPGVAAPIPNALPGHSATLTLTFDDCGTADQMQAVVAALGEVHEQGIFFITGQCRDHFPWLVATLQAGGNLVCNHT
jgi:hypothetical protein